MAEFLSIDVLVLVEQIYLRLQLGAVLRYQTLHFNITDKLVGLQTRSARNTWLDFDVACLQPLWPSCSHKCASVTKRCNLVPTKKQ